MFGFPVWAIVIASLVACFLFAWLGFKGNASRLKAFVVLLPLPLMGIALHQKGLDIRTESGITDSHETRESYTKPSTLMATSQHESSATISSPLNKMMANGYTLSGLSWPDKGKSYNPTTLWNRIDGGAEIYKRYNLKRALFATAQFDGNDIEIQLFDLSSAENAQKYFKKATEGNNDNTLENVGDAAVLWEGGGEFTRNEVYGKIVLTTGNDIPAVAAIPEKLIRLMAVETLKTDMKPSVPAVEDETEGSSSDKNQATQPTDNTPELPPAPTTNALKNANEVTVMDAGWNGRRYLGRVRIGRWDSGQEAFVAGPADIKAALEKLKESFPSIEGPNKAGFFNAADPYQGDVLLGASEQRIAAVIAYTDPKMAQKLLKQLLEEVTVKQNPSK